MTSSGVDRLQLRACAILRDQGEVLVQTERANPVRWALPGGRLERGETLDDCLRREFREEMDLEIIPERVVFVHENLFVDEGSRVQEYGFYWLCRSPHPTQELRRKTAAPVEKHLLFRWFAPADLSSLLIYPEFLSRHLTSLPVDVLYFSTRDPNFG